MKISTLLLVFASASLFVFSSCKKGELEGATTGKASVTTTVKDTTATTTSTVYKRTVNLGTGSGVLTIDGKTLAVQCNDLIKIKGGTYTGINIKNILSADGCPITIKNDGLVEVVGDHNEMSLTDLKNVTISGDGTASIAKGFVFRDNNYRGIEGWGALNNLTIQNISFKNVLDMCISYQYNNLYDGTAANYVQNLKFLNISCNATGQFLGTGGYIDNGNVYGLFKNVEIANLDYQNSPTVGILCYMGNAENFNIHNNRINNINTLNNNHNGIFMISGNGSFHHNYVSNHQGNAIRAWGHSVGTTPKNIYIYDNIVVNSRKYSGFEVQAFANRMIAGKTTYTNAVVFNNTCGNLNLSADWIGAVVDVYSLQGGKVDVYNNLAYNFKANANISNEQQDLVPNTFNNLKYDTYAQAGIVNETTFKLTSTSPAKGAGVATPFIITDYYGSLRAAKPSIGAVE